MIPTTIENIIVKYLTTQITVNELDILENWLLDSDNELLFKEFVKTNFLIDINTKEFDKERIIEELSLKINTKNKPKWLHSIKPMMRYAAVFLLFLSAFFIYQNSINLKQTTAENSIDEVILKSENGLVTILTPSGELLIKSRV